MREFQDYRKKKGRELAKILQDSGKQKGAVTNDLCQLFIYLFIFVVSDDDGENSFKEEVFEFLVSEEILIVGDNE